MKAPKVAISTFGAAHTRLAISSRTYSRRTSNAVIEEAISELEAESTEWVPSSGRRQPPDDLEIDESEPSQTELYALMQDRVKEIVEALARVPEAPTGMGHNRPPEPMDVEPLDAGDRKETSDALVGLAKAGSSRQR
jgi:hypothetical protein